MFRPLPLIAMRQQADEARHAQPLALAAGNELVEDHLRAIGEVAELRFPDGQRIGLGQRIAIFEAEHGFFRQHGVDGFDLDLLVLHQVIERRVALLGFLIDQHGMALREGAALHVLARQAHGEAFHQQRAEGQLLGHRPVEARAVLDHLAARVEHALHGAVDLEGLGHLGELEADLLELGRRQRRSGPCADPHGPCAAFRPAQRPSSQSALLAL